MFKLFNKQIDPALNLSADDVDYKVTLHAGNNIYDVIEYDNMYFSKDSFIAKAYVCANGVILFIPTFTDALEEDEKEQKRLVASLKEIKDLLTLHVHIFPVFITGDCFYFGRPVGEKLTKVSRIPDIDLFINNLLYGINELYLEINEVNNEYYETDLTVDAYYNQDHYVDEPYCCHMPSLDDETLRYVDRVCSRYENNIRPTDKYKVDENGQEWVCRDKAVSLLGYVDTGLVNGKAWYKVTQDFDTERMSLLTMLLGWTGVHWFYLGKKMKALAYLLTCGCFGVMPFVDLLQMAMGTFTYTDVDYESVPVTIKDKSKMVQERYSEKIYFKKPAKWYKTAIMSIVSLAIGLLLSCTLYVTIYRALGIVSNDAAVGLGDILKESGIIKSFYR